MWKRILIFAMLFCILSVPVLAQAGNTFDRSEERRVGKECS